MVEGRRGSSWTMRVAGHTTRAAIVGESKDGGGQLETQSGLSISGSVSRPASRGRSSETELSPRGGIYGWFARRKARGLAGGGRNLLWLSRQRARLGDRSFLDPLFDLVPRLCGPALPR